MDKDGFFSVACVVRQDRNSGHDPNDVNYYFCLVLEEGKLWFDCVVGNTVGEDVYSTFLAGEYG